MTFTQKTQNKNYIIYPYDNTHSKSKISENCILLKQFNGNFKKVQIGNMPVMKRSKVFSSRLT